jgi:hypothetical protein
VLLPLLDVVPPLPLLVLPLLPPEPPPLAVPEEPLAVPPELPPQLSLPMVPSPWLHPATQSSERTTATFDRMDAPDLSGGAHDLLAPACD